MANKQGAHKKFIGVAMPNLITLAQFRQIHDQRSAQVRDLIRTSIDAPEGYVWIANKVHMLDHGVIQLRSARVSGAHAQPVMQINFLHRIHFRSKKINGKFLVAPTKESVLAVRGILRNGNWVRDEPNWLATSVANGGDLSAAVRETISDICSRPPFICLGRSDIR